MVEDAANAILIVKLAMELEISVLPAMMDTTKIVEIYANHAQQIVKNVPLRIIAYNAKMDIIWIQIIMMSVINAQNLKIAKHAEMKALEIIQIFIALIAEMESLLHKVFLMAQKDVAHALIIALNVLQKTHAPYAITAFMNKMVIAYSAKKDAQFVQHQILVQHAIQDTIQMDREDAHDAKKDVLIAHPAQLVQIAKVMDII